MEQNILVSQCLAPMQTPCNIWLFCPDAAFISQFYKVQFEQFHQIMARMVRGKQLKGAALQFEISQTSATIHTHST